VDGQGYKVLFGERPTGFFMVGGAADGYTSLNAFDAALIDAGIGDVNLVKVTSILPPGCAEIASTTLPGGTIAPVAYAYIISDIPGEVISAAVGAALPLDPSKPGLIMEYSARGHKKDAEEIVRTMAVKGMRIRERDIREIKSLAVEHKVQTIGAALAAVVLWPLRGSGGC